MTLRKEIETPRCQYCNDDAQWVENKEIYGRNYGKSYMVWLCKKCDAYVGCHNNTKKPLGMLANKELREARKQAKNLFISKKLEDDWKNKQLRAKGYDWLKTIFNKEFHFGESTINECKLVIKTLRREGRLK